MTEVVRHLEVNATSLSWNQPICERDWISRSLAMYDEIRRPVLVTEPLVEVCAWCGEPTIFGAFVRENPAVVPYPAKKE